MTNDLITQLEERLSILEFKLDLVLKLTKNDLNLTLNECKTMIEFAYVMNLKKSEFEELEALLTTQINFYKTIKQNTYISSRQYPKLDAEIDVFKALSKEEFEDRIWTCVPKFKDNPDICYKIAKMNGIQEMYYEELATKIHKSKHERLDKETKLRNTYFENKATVDALYEQFSTLDEELKINLNRISSIIDFFTKNELVRISEFYNGELWEKGEDDKRVVISEESYIRHVVDVKQDEILNIITNALKDPNNEYKELLIYLLKSSTSSSKKIETLQDFYKLIKTYNNKEYVDKAELVSLKAEIAKHIQISEDIIKSYEEYVNSLK